MQSKIKIFEENFFLLYGLRYLFFYISSVPPPSQLGRCAPYVRLTAHVGGAPHR